MLLLVLVFVQIAFEEKISDCELCCFDLLNRNYSTIVQFVLSLDQRLAKFNSVIATSMIIDSAINRRSRP